MKGLLAQKIGMTRVICSDTGKVIPVTLLQVSPASVLQVKTVEKDSYSALVVGGFSRKNYGKNENKKYKFIKEISIEESQQSEFVRGDSLSLSWLKNEKCVTIEGRSKGRGFSGVIKRHNFGRGPETHGSHHHREPGSVGTCAKPARILKGRKMPGRHGNDQVTRRDVDIVSIDVDKSLIAIKGAVPGSISSFVCLRCR